MKHSHALTVLNQKINYIRRSISRFIQPKPTNIFEAVEVWDNWGDYHDLLNEGASLIKQGYTSTDLDNDERNNLIAEGRALQQKAHNMCRDDFTAMLAN